MKDFQYLLFFFPLCIFQGIIQKEVENMYMGDIIITG